MGKVHVLLLGLGVLVALVLPTITTVEQPWGTKCELDWCAILPPPVDELGDLSDLAEASEGAECLTMAGWPEGEIPTSIVIRDAATGEVSRIPFDKAWKLAEDGKAWMVLACR